MSRRLYVLGGVLAAIGTLAAVILFEVLGTVFLALSVAYLLVPLRRRLRRRFSRLTSTLAVTATAVGGVAALFGPLAYLLIVRFSEVTALIRGLPESIPLQVAGFTYDLVVSDVITVVSRELTALAGAIASSLPVLLIKLTLFVLLVFSLLHNQQDIRSGVLTVVPPNYRDIVEALHTRARETLFALYVLQAATAIGTFLIALPVFVLFGYGSSIVLATVAGILQFVPIAGPSLLIAVLVGGHLLAGDIGSALAVGLVGGALIAWLPDLLIRPRIASRTADMDGSLYFIGFVGGLLSLGAIGIIVGPLVVSLLVEAAGLVAQEFETSVDTPPEAPTEPASDPTNEPTAKSSTTEPAESAVDD